MSIVIKLDQENISEIIKRKVFKQFLLFNGIVANTISAKLESDGVINIDLIETHNDFKNKGLAVANFDHFKKFCFDILGAKTLSSTAGSEESQRLINKLGFKYTPKHMATQFLENEK